MRMHQIAFVAVLSVSVPAALSAQTTDTTRGRTTGTTTTTTTSTQTTDANSGSTSSSTDSHWIASGFVGSNFNNNSNNLLSNATTSAATTSSGNSLDFGGQVGYLWRNIAGAEFLAGFTPNFDMQNALIPAGATPWVNTYMVNAVGAAPLGSSGSFQPFISGGVGVITMRGLNGSSNVTSANGVSGTTSAVANNLFNPDESRAGGNIGGGIMAFMGNVGVRGDVRYFRAFTTNNTITDTVNSGSSDILPGLNFWRGNIGVAFRW